MFALLSRVVRYLKNGSMTVVRAARAHPKKAFAASAVVVVTLGLVFHTKNTAVAPVAETVPTVTIAPVAAYTNDKDSVVLLGEVRSMSQAELRAQASGEVTRVNVKAGQYVGAGTVLVEIENAAERAQVLSAQGAVAAAQATLTKVRNGARSEDKASASAQAAGAATALVSAREGARSAYSSAYSAAQDAVYAKADVFFSNPTTVLPSFRVTSADYDERSALSRTRVELGDTLDIWKKKALSPVADGDLDAYLGESQRDLGTLKAFLDGIAYYISTQKLTDEYTASDRAADDAVIAAARAEIDLARQGVTAARTGLAGALSGEQIASLTESKVVTGAQTEDVQAAEAVYLQARGALAGALAALERTLVRAPIAGTVTSLSVSRGDFVSAHQSVAVVAHDGGQEIVANTSDTVRSLLAPGMTARIDDRYTGVVTQADAGLDPDTKQARVTIGLTEDAALTNGAFVNVSIMLQATSTTPAATGTGSGWYLPITAIKVLPDGLAVFSVGDDGTLVAHSIPEGTIIGDRMRVASGITSDLTIVTDARGLIEGERVQVAKE